jgi:hypothetical protein
LYVRAATFREVAQSKPAKQKNMRTNFEGRPTAKDTILLGGLAIGILDFFDATLFFGLYSGAPFQRVGKASHRDSSAVKPQKPADGTPLCSVLLSILS